MPVMTKYGKLMEDPWIQIFYTENTYRDYPWFSIVPLEGLADKSQWPLDKSWTGAWFRMDIGMEELTQRILSLPILNIVVEHPLDSRIFSLVKKLRTVH